MIVKIFALLQKVFDLLFSYLQYKYQISTILLKVLLIRESWKNVSQFPHKNKSQHDKNVKTGLDQMHAALMSIRHFFQKHFYKNFNPKTWEQEYCLC